MTEDMRQLRDLLVAALYVVGALLAVSIAFRVLQAIWAEIFRKIRGPMFLEPCGILDVEERPCYLPRNHKAREHATEWESGTPSKEFRWRWDDDAVEGRKEYRLRPSSNLPRVTRSGDVVRAGK